MQRCRQRQRQGDRCQRQESTHPGANCDQTMQRTTRQRTAIQHALVQAGRPLAAREILEAAQADVPGLGVATVYRTLKSLLEEGAVLQVDLPGETPIYESAPRSHHHHFRCRKCNGVFEVNACPQDVQSLAPPGFKIEGHEVVLYGLCASCASWRRSRRRPGGSV